MALLSSLFDNFNDNSFDSAKWYQFTSSGVSIAETSNELIITPPSTTSGSVGGGFGSQSTYDFTNSAVFVKVVRSFSAANGDVYLSLYTSNFTIAIDQYGQYLQFTVRDRITGATSQSRFIYDSSSDVWWRIRHIPGSGSGSVSFDTSSDGNVYTSRWTTAIPGYAITNTTAELGASSWGNIGSSNIAIFDNVNYFQQSQTTNDSAGIGGSAIVAFQKAVYSLGEIAGGGGNATYLTIFQPLPEKDYEHRVFDHSGNFISIWQDVTSDFSYTQNINENASELPVHISRSPDNRLTTYDALQDTSASNILDNNSEIIRVATTTANSVGPGTDIVENYNVDVYAFYGGYEALEDSSGAIISDTTGDTIYVGFGYPNGIRVYSGYIADYELTFGATTGVDVTIVPHATEMDHYVFEDGTGHTTINYATVDPVTMARDAMDYYNSQGGIITYSTSTMPLSGQTGSYDFRLQTIRDVIDKSVNLLPSGYYQYVHPGENTQYLLNEGTSADHTFYYEQHISELKLKKSITQLVNDVFFIGGDDGTGSSLYKHFSDSTSITNYRRGLLKLSDSRVTTADGADLLSNQQIDEYKDPHYRTSVTINDADYDIESIRLGQMVAFANFASFVDDLLLQIVGITRNKHNVVLDLDMVVPTDTKRLYELRKQLDTTIEENIPSIPS